MNKPLKPEQQHQQKKDKPVFSPLKRSFTETESGIYLGLSTSFLRQKRIKGTIQNKTPGPKFIRLGKRAIRYLREDLDAYLDQFKKHDHIHEDDVL